MVTEVRVAGAMLERYRYKGRETNMESSAEHHPLLAALEPERMKQVLGQAPMVSLETDHQVFRPGERCQGLPLVLQGSVRVQMVGCSGNEIVLYRIGDADVCTLSIGCLMSAQHYRAEAVVEQPTTALLLSATLFDQLMAESAAFRREVMAAYGRRLDSLMLVIEEVAFGRMDKRLAAWLTERAAHGGALALTHQAVAVELGTAREVVSRLLKEFERSGLVSLGRRSIRIVDADGLARLALRGN